MYLAAAEISGLPLYLLASQLIAVGSSCRTSPSAPSLDASAALTGAMQALLPGMMAFAAGAMLLVTFSEMIPIAGGGRDGAAAALVGYVLMMALDMGLG